jgi:AraC family transcriptional activator of mtrCDE
MAVDPPRALDQPFIRPPSAELDRLLATLEVKVVFLSECLVSPGWRLQLPGHAALGIHYNLMGEGSLEFEGEPPIATRPHTLVVLPPGRSFALEVDAQSPRNGPLQVQDYRGSSEERAVTGPVQVRRRVAGVEPELIVICGYFEAVFGATIDLFSGLTSPIIEQFDASDQIDHALRQALNELISQEIGRGAMATALLKQVMVSLLRRSLSSNGAWVERFSVLSDPQITRAFAAMVERPGAPHTVQSLAKAAGLSRTAFMDRFRQVFLKTPMAALRDLRMRQAARAIVAGQASVDQIAHEAGYQDRTGFQRAFRKVYGCDVAEFRAVVDNDDLFVGP